MVLLGFAGATVVDEALDTEENGGALARGLLGVDDKDVCAGDEGTTGENVKPREDCGILLCCDDGCEGLLSLSR